MAGIDEMNALEAKRRALAAESEVYRQTLRIELQNLRLHTAQFKRRLSGWSTIPLLVLTPLVGNALGSRLGETFWGRRQRSRWPRLIQAGMTGWRLYRQFKPVVQAIFGASAARAAAAAEGNE